MQHNGNRQQFCHGRRPSDQPSLSPATATGSSKSAFPRSPYDGEIDWVNITCFEVIKAKSFPDVGFILLFSISTAQSPVFIESQKAFRNLDDVDSLVFPLFQHWLHSRRFDGFFTRNIFSKAETGTPEEILENVAKKRKMVIKVWILVQRFLVAPMQNYSIDVLHQLWTQYQTLDMQYLELVYAETTYNSLLRRCIVDVYLRYSNYEVKEEKIGTASEELCEDLGFAKHLHEWNPRRYGGDILLEDYHIEN